MSGVERPERGWRLAGRSDAGPAEATAQARQAHKHHRCPELPSKSGVGPGRPQPTAHSLACSLRLCDALQRHAYIVPYPPPSLCASRLHALPKRLVEFRSRPSSGRPPASP